jgi:hypothetical protein
MRRTELATGVLIFGFTCAVFLLSIVQQAADSNYSLLLSESLLYHRTFSLDNHGIPRFEPKQQVGWVSDGEIYQLEYVDGRLYYFFPPGSSILSLPYVAVMNASGVSATYPDGTYNYQGELKLQKYLAALLMAGFAAIIFFTARLILPPAWSVLVALGSALGTQVWSTASRGLWADTWGLFLFGIVAWMLLAHEVGRYRLRPVLLASLLAWTYFVRPTSSVPILIITGYLFLSYPRRAFVRYVMTGAAWFLGFALFSFYNYGQLLPNYYRANRLTFEAFPVALAGNLISPSRGLLIFVPVVIFIAYLLVRYAKELTHRRLVAVCLSIVVAHQIVTAGFSPWWGGHCYGPRYMTGLVPWFVLLSILAIKAALTWREKYGTAGVPLNRKAEWALGATLLLCSMVINGRGAMNPRTSRWNFTPVNVDQSPERLWDWKDPQFLR